jgi:hypothetical protein
MLYQHKKSLTQIKVISDSIYNHDIQDFCVMFTRFEDTTENCSSWQKMILIVNSKYNMTYMNLVKLW